MNIYNKIVKKDAVVAVIGLGYVGLPIALAFAKKVRVIGFDINESRVQLMNKGIDPSNELTKKDFAGSNWKILRRQISSSLLYPPPLTNIIFQT
jgi:UDP-N-acetyl-D-galactosamine dehydrogenase